MNMPDPSEFGVSRLSYSWSEQENVVCVGGVGGGLGITFVLMSIPHSLCLGIE